MIAFCFFKSLFGYSGENGLEQARLEVRRPGSQGYSEVTQDEIGPRDGNSEASAKILSKGK